MQDVADAAGVHRTTVSMALRNHPSIPEETRRRLADIATKMGYRPNPLVSALMIQLRSQRPHDSHEVIAYVTSHFAANPWRRHSALTEMFEGAAAKAKELGFGLEEFERTAPGMSPHRLKEILLARGIRGIVLAPLPDGMDHIDLDLSKFATVALGVSLQSPSLERIANDHFQSFRVVFQECARLGYQRIGFVVGQDFSERLEGRWLGAYLYGQHDLKPSRRLRPLLLKQLHVQLCAPEVEAWCRRERPDVIVSPLGAAQNAWLKEWRSLPGSPGVVNLTLPRESGECAGILQDAFKLGQIAVERMVARLQHNDIGPLPRTQNTMLHGSWANGASLPPRAVAAAEPLNAPKRTPKRRPAAPEAK